MACKARRYSKKYDPLAEVVTDKVNAEIPHHLKGLLRSFLRKKVRHYQLGQSYARLK